jgi:hypothetical protein
MYVLVNVDIDVLVIDVVALFVVLADVIVKVTPGTVIVDAVLLS